MSESVPDPFVGRTVGGYKIDEILGRGGMGTVYRATQLSLGRAVAIKVLPPDLAEDPQFLERFHREADVLSRLAHPNVVTVFDRGEMDGRPYLVMEYVEGTNLRDVLRKGPLPPAEALRITSSVLHALEHAHGRGIVHRDIKPENVLLAKSEIVKVADFGLSRLLGDLDDTRLTRTHLLLGTYEYMAPEQRERSREADARADLYAAGVVLYEMLTGELPIGRFDLPSKMRPGECDRRLDDIVATSLEKDPDQRYADAAAMGDAVSAVLEHPEAASDFQPLIDKAHRAFHGVHRAMRNLGKPDPRRYQPARFEHHIDNVATIDHVLGTVAYALGFLALFGVGITKGFRWFGIPFFAMFIAGWYLRETAEGLRAYKTSARTSQAVIAILAAFTGLLIPVSIYSFWVLYGHRGRTYYEARGRGLRETAAARHTWRLLEEPYGDTAPPPPPEPEAPRPEDIPVQSVVTSEVEPQPNPARRLSGFVSAGLILGACVFAAPFVTLVPERVALVGAAATAALLLVGFFHALTTPRVHGALLAFVLLVFATLGWLLVQPVAPADVPAPSTERVR